MGKHRPGEFNSPAEEKNTMRNWSLGILSGFRIHLEKIREFCPEAADETFRLLHNCNEAERRIREEPRPARPVKEPKRKTRKIWVS